MNKDIEEMEKERVWVFVAYNEDVPFFSKLFTNHEDMKMFSAQHSSFYKKQPAIKYTSTYFDLTDKSELTLAHNNALTLAEEAVTATQNQYRIPNKKTKEIRFSGSAQCRSCLKRRDSIEIKVAQSTINSLRK